MNNMSKYVVLVFVSLMAFGCAGRAMEPRVAEKPENVERAIEVEEGSISDYTVRAGHWAVEAGQGTAEAAEDTWEWMREKKRRAQKWVHEKTEPEKE